MLTLKGVKEALFDTELLIYKVCCRCRAIYDALVPLLGDAAIMI
jgi:hypothetical protein